jgi:hypothetical protein
MKSRTDLLKELNIIEKQERQLLDEIARINAALTGNTGTVIAGTLTAGGIAASWATFGLSLAVSVACGIWFAKETIEKTKARRRVAAINDELMSLGERRRALQAALANAPPP